MAAPVGSTRPDASPLPASHLAFDLAPDLLALVDESGALVSWNPAWHDRLGHDPADLRSVPFVQFVHPEDRAAAAEAIERVAASPVASGTLECRVRAGDGGFRWHEWVARPVPDLPQAFLWGRDVHDRRAEESRCPALGLHRVEPRDGMVLEGVLETTSDLVVVWDSEGGVVFSNASARTVLGGEPATLDAVYPAWARERLENALPELRRRGMWSGELAVIAAGGREVPVSQVTVLHQGADGHEHVSAVARDISEHKRREAELAHRATHDGLTGLPNRVLFLERLRTALSRAARDRDGRQVAVLFLDLDRFKLINDSLGHEIGDQLLVSLSSRLEKLLRPADMIARLGGDEFVVLCEDMDERSALAVADRILDAIGRPFDLSSGRVFVTTSIGVAVGSGMAPEALMENADVAMYRAKDGGRARCELFDAELRSDAAARLEMETALRLGLERGELRVFYQPQFSLRTGSLVGVEALVRWQHPELGLLGAGEFMQVAEDTGLVLPIDGWVLDQACRQARAWEQEFAGSEAITINVNLSARQFTQPDLPHAISRAVLAAGIQPGRLCLEITESVVMDAVEPTIATLLELRSLGVEVGIDDFGTGYSSLSYLRRLPVDVLKIDKSFVARLGEDMVDSAIVSSVVNLARSLGIAVVAEGVETEQQRMELQALGCPVAQGYYFSHPLAPEAVAELLVNEPWR